MLLAVLVGCGGQTAPESTAPESTAPESTAPESSEPDTITITDHAGEEVTVPRNIERVAVCGIFPMPSVLSVFFNSAEKIVAMPESSMTAAQNSLLGQLYPEILNAETACVSGETINAEELMKLNPDVVFYSAGETATAEALRAAGFTAVGISVNLWDYDCIETLNNWISLLSEMFPQDDKAAAVREKNAEIYELVQTKIAENTEKPRIFVLFQYSESVMLTSGKNYFGQWWCDSVGAINVAEEFEQDKSVAVNLEQVYAWNPDIILVTNFTKAQPDDILNSSFGSDDWSGIKAVEDGRVYKLPLGIYRGYTPGADTPITLLWLAKAVHPELFADVDVTEMAKEYYLDLFGIELTDEQVESIFKPNSAAASDYAG